MADLVENTDTTENQDPNAAAAGAGGEGAGSNSSPFYAEFGFEEEPAFVEHYKQTKEQATTLAAEVEKLRNNPEFDYEVLGDLNKYIKAEKEGGASDEDVIRKAADYLTAISKPWAKLANESPVDVLLEQQARKYPGIPRDDLKQAILSQYGLDNGDEKPDEERDPEGHRKWIKAQQIAKTKIMQDATEAATALESQKASMKVHPRIAEANEKQKQGAELVTRLTPEYHAAVKTAASSLHLEVDGVKIPLKLDAQALASIEGYDLRAFVENGKVNPEKVGAFMQKLAVANNFTEIARQLVNHGKTLATKEHVNGARNPGEGGGTAGDKGAGRGTMNNHDYIKSLV